MRKLRMMTLYNKNQIAYEDFLCLVNVIPNKYSFLFSSIDKLFVSNIKECVDYSEDKKRGRLFKMLSNTKTIISIFDAFLKVKIVTENQYLRFQEQTNGLLAYLKAMLFKNGNKV